MVKIQPPCVCVLLSWREYLESLVRHECFATFVLSTPEGVVEHRTLVTQFVPSCLYGVIAWTGFVGAWKGGCLGCSSRVQDLVVRYLYIRSCNDSYQVYLCSTMKIGPYKLQSCVPYTYSHQCTYLAPRLALSLNGPK